MCRAVLASAETERGDHHRVSGATDEKNHVLMQLLREAVAIISICLGATWIFLGKFLTGEHSVATFQDNTYFLVPFFAYISKSLASGQFPYWINSIAGGVPLYNTPQFSLLYPFYFFGWNLYRSPIDTSLHIHYVTLLHVAILWLNTYVMMRIFRLRILSSIIGATLFAFCANTYKYIIWVNIISPYSWFPLALASVFLILENQRPKTGLILGLLSTYFLISASPAQPLIHFVFCSAFLFISYAIVHRRNKGRLRAPFRNLVILGLGSILLTSAILIPTFLFAKADMLRWTDAGVTIGDQQIPFQGFLTGQTEVKELAKVLFPLNIDQLSGDSYLGILPVLLALFGIFKWKQNWIVRTLAVMGLYAVLSSTGTHLGLAYINHAIPLWNKIREPSRHLYIFALAACTLAAFGFEYLTELSTSHTLGSRKHMYVFCAFLGGLLLSYGIRRDYVTLVNDSTLLWPFVIFSAVVYGVRFLPQMRGLLPTVLAAIVVYPSLCYPPTIPRIRDGDYFAEENLRSERVLQELAKIKDIEKYRLIVSDKWFSSKYWSMNAIYYGLRTFDAFLNPSPAKETLEMSMALTRPQYSRLLGAKYYLSCVDRVSGGRPGQNDIQWPAEGKNQITLINPSGAAQALDAGLHDRIAQLTYNEGWIPINALGHPYKVINFAGGQMFVDFDRGNQAAPLNVILGGSWSPSQVEALPRFLAENPGVLGGLDFPARDKDSESSFSSTEDVSIPAGYSLAREIEGCKLYSSPDAKPYYFLSTVIDSYTGDQEFLDRVEQSENDSGSVLVPITNVGTVSEWLTDTSEPLQFETFGEKHSINSFDLSIRTNRRSLLVLNEYFRDEWEVTTNGQRQKVFKVNLNQIGVLLPAGSNQVHFEYRPRLFLKLWNVQRVAFAIFAGGFIGVGLLAWVKSRRSGLVGDQ
jgi:hypothetical protein